MKVHAGFRVIIGMDEYVDFYLFMRPELTMEQLHIQARVCARLLSGRVVRRYIWKKRLSKKHV